MRKLMAAAAMALMLVGAAGEASAAVNMRQLNQQRRIDAGVRSGKLTRAEAMRLKAEQRSIRVAEARARARHGGKLTARDKARIHTRQNVANRHILREKRDAQRGRNHLRI